MKLNVFEAIHISRILVFEHFKEGFNTDKHLDIMRKYLKFKNSWGQFILLVADNLLVHKNTTTKKFVKN